MTIDIFSELTWRGLIHQTTDDQGLPGWLAERGRTLDAGFDPTADSLHVGHLMALMILRRFQRAGHKPIALVGGATGMIGEPSGKSEGRNLLSGDTSRSSYPEHSYMLLQAYDFVYLNEHHGCELQVGGSDQWGNITAG